MEAVLTRTNPSPMGPVSRLDVTDCGQKDRRREIRATSAGFRRPRRIDPHESSVTVGHPPHLPMLEFRLSEDRDSSQVYERHSAHLSHAATLRVPDRRFAVPSPPADRRLKTCCIACHPASRRLPRRNEVQEWGDRSIHEGRIGRYSYSSALVSLPRCRRWALEVRAHPGDGKKPWKRPGKSRSSGSLRISEGSG